MKKKISISKDFGNDFDRKVHESIQRTRLHKKKAHEALEENKISTSKALVQALIEKLMFF